MHFKNTNTKKALIESSVGLATSITTLERVPHIVLLACITLVSLLTISVLLISLVCTRLSITTRTDIFTFVISYNLLNKVYETAYGYKQVTRSAFLGLNWTM